MGKDIATQINFEIPEFGAYENFALPAGIMPVVWTQDRVLIDPDQAEQFLSGLSLASTMRTVGFVLGPLLFFCCLGGAVFAYFRDRRNGGAFEEMDQGTAMY